MVCDSDSIAQMLIANNFHFENNCAVLSIAGYPQSIFSTVLDMLRRNQSLKVYALYDATPAGVSLSELSGKVRKVPGRNSRTYRQRVRSPGTKAQQR